MQVWSPTAWIVLALTTVAISALVTGASIRYANVRQLIDRPGKRRSHRVPTPRGGGIGIVVAVLLSLLALAAADVGSLRSPATMTLAGSIIVVALAGWIDDHRGLGATWRLAAHGFAAGLLGLPTFVLLFPEAGANPALPWIVAACVTCAIALVWSINLHNFMDGIDGLLAAQSLFVFGVLAWICHRAGRIEQAQEIGLFAAATLGFLPFNFPRARIFMGDVGSGVLGLLVAVAVFRQMTVVPAAFWAGLIVCSAFIVDGTATLLSRILSGRRWYSAHREHLYQWLVRAGFSHVQVVGLYMAWNVVVVFPAVCWEQWMAGTGSPGEAGAAFSSAGGGWALFAVYALGVVAWVSGKRFCLRAPRVRHPTST